MEKMAKILKQFNLNHLPRAVGNPFQYFVTKPKNFFLFITNNNGKKTCYTSHNNYTDFDEYDNPTHVRTHNLFLDFDMDEEVGIPFDKTARDAYLVSEYLSDENIQHTISFSGRGGYHIYIHLKPTEEKLNNGLTDKYKSIYAHLKKNLNLKTIDQRCADAKRLCRIPMTKYTKNREKTDRKCIPVHQPIDDKEEMYEKSKKEVKMDDYVISGDRCSIDELIEKWNIKQEQFRREEIYGTVAYNPPEDMPLVAEFFKPCVQNMLFTQNPPHFVRVSACSKIKRIGYSLEEAKKLFDRMAHKYNWIDRENQQNRYYHIQHIYKRDYRMPSCRKIMEEGYCIGKECDNYHLVKNGNGEGG